MQIVDLAQKIIVECRKWPKKYCRIVEIQGACRCRIFREKSCRMQNLVRKKLQICRIIGLVQMQNLTILNVEINFSKIALNVVEFEKIMLQIEPFFQVFVDVEIRSNFIVEMQKIFKNLVESTIGQDPPTPPLFTSKFHKIFKKFLHFYNKICPNFYIYKNLEKSFNLQPDILKFYNIQSNF